MKKFVLGVVFVFMSFLSYGAIDIHITDKDYHITHYNLLGIDKDIVFNVYTKLNKEGQSVIYLRVSFPKGLIGTSIRNLPFIYFWLSEYDFDNYQKCIYCDCNNANDTKFENGVITFDFILNEFYFNNIITKCTNVTINDKNIITSRYIDDFKEFFINRVYVSYNSDIEIGGNKNLIYHSLDKLKTISSTRKNENKCSKKKKNF